MVIAGSTPAHPTLHQLKLKTMRVIIFYDLNEEETSEQAQKILNSIQHELEGRYVITNLEFDIEADN